MSKARVVECCFFHFCIHDYLLIENQFTLHRDYDTSEAKATVIEAIHQGINYIDVAPHYGLGVAEKFLGKVYLYD